MTSLYFGCARGIDGRREVGHHWYEPNREPTRWTLWSVSGRVAEPLNPWGIIDGKLAPRLVRGQLAIGAHPRRGEEAAQGVALLHYKDGWTALAFWDRSGDRRGNSSSTFLFDEELGFAAALARAKAEFPTLFERYPFEVTEAPR